MNKFQPQLLVKAYYNVVVIYLNTVTLLISKMQRNVSVDLEKLANEKILYAQVGGAH